MARVWSAVLLAADLSPRTISRVARCPLPHSWVVAREGVPAPHFSLRHLRPEHVTALVELVADLDADYLASTQLPPLHASGVRPSPDPGDPETFATVPWLLGGRAPRDCKGVAAWRLAELRLAGERALPLVDALLEASGVLAYHVRVLRASGEVEDPLAALRWSGPLTDL